MEQNLNINKCNSCNGCKSHISEDNKETSCNCPVKNGSCLSIKFEDNKQYDCRLLATIEVNEQEYVVLEHPYLKSQLLYRYDEKDGKINLGVISGSEFDLVAKVYKSMRKN